MESAAFIIYLLPCSIILWLFGFILLYRRISFFLTSIRTIGEIVGSTQSTSSGRPIYYARVSYLSQAGQKHEIVGGAGRRDKPKLGGSSTILYDPHKPEKGMIEGALNYWAAPVAFLILAASSTFALLKEFKIL